MNSAACHPGKRSPGPFLAVAAVALATRAAYLALFRGSPLFDVYAVDHLYYRTWGRALAAGAGLGDVFEQGPLYAFLLGALYRMGWDDVHVLVLQLLTGVLGAVLVCAAGTRLFGRPAGVAAGLLAAVYGPLVFYEAMLMKSALAAPLTAVVLFCAVRYGEDPRPWKLAVAGAATGLLCLKREIHATLLVPLLAAAWRPAGVQDRGGLRRLRHGLVLLGVFLMVLAPAVAHNMRRGSAPAVTSLGGEVFYKAFGPHATAYGSDPPFVRSFVWTEHQDFRDQAMFLSGRMLTRSETSRFWFFEGLRALRDDPLRVLRLEGEKLALLFNDYEVPDTESFTVTREWIPLLRFLPTFGWILGPAAAGAVFAWRSGGSTATLFWFLAVSTANILLTHNLGRYRLGLVVVLLLLAGNGLAGIVAGLRSGVRSRRRDALTIAAVALLASSSAFLPPPAMGRALRERSEAGFRRDRLDRAAARDAIAPLRAALAATPGELTLRHRLAHALEHSGKLPEAEAEYRAILEAAPGDEAGRWRLSQLLQGQGRIVEAALVLEPLALAHPENFELHQASGILHARLATDPSSGSPAGHASRAAEHFTAAARLRPADPDPHYDLGRLLLLTGRPREARIALSRALERQPDHAEARFLLEHLAGSR